MRPEHIKAERREFFTVDQTAELMGISRETLYRMMKRAELAWLTIGKRRWIPAHEIERITQTTTTGNPEKESDHDRSEENHSEEKNDQETRPD